MQNEYVGCSLTTRHTTTAISVGYCKRTGGFANALRAADYSRLCRIPLRGTAMALAWTAAGRVGSDTPPASFG